ncbi:aldo/keto reductase [Microbacterium sp. NPDC056234]|uniref:aldo/keto reductase n=1 Tax=Microbacterium sp. NPDC056234 TaxID=3345757 RepID=UPI0035DE37A9
MSTARNPLPRLGLGTAQLGNLYRATTDDEAAGAIAEAWNGGIRYFDTAPHYGLGLSERRLGTLLRAFPRDQYVVSTKVGRLLVPSPETATERDRDFDVPADVKRVWDFSRDGIRRSVDASLARLNLDYLDIVYLHDPDDHWHAASTTGIDALVELRDQGIVRRIGAGMNQSEMLAEFVRRCDVDVVMVAGRYTLLDDSAADKLLPLAQERDIAVVAAAVYNSGLLSRARPAPNAHYDYGPVPKDILVRANDIADLAELFGAHLPDLALQFALRSPAIHSVVVGARTAEQVRTTIERFNRDIPGALWEHLEHSGLISAS